MRRIVDRFESWNLEGLPIEFDAIYDAPIGTKALLEIYAAVRAVPLVGKPSGGR